eukprot:TRINITY_DN13180_c0_g1_i1.p1 TRINITY_DN13180_c0_g1~~TRINITY_DN13180_c0_g1_i1.p1  ORF type:complete len:295 (+),score=21.35 TRINITY_DN13180_c0_g1_i1:40-924(+)
MFTTVAPVFPAGLRLYEERFLRNVNILVALGCLVCAVITLTNVSTNAEKTVKDFWFPSGDLSLDTFLESSFVSGCGYVSDMSIGDYNVEQFRLDETTRAPIIALTTGLIKRGVLVSSGAVLMTFVNKIGFNYNWHEVRYGSVFISKGFLLLLEVVMIVWAIIALNHPADLASHLETYIQHCTSEPPDHLFKTPPFTAMFVAHGVTLFVYIINGFLLFSNATRSIPGHILDEWDEIASVLRRCPKDSTVPGYLHASLEREIEGTETEPGVKHLLAYEYKLLEPPAEEADVDRDFN